MCDSQKINSFCPFLPPCASLFSKTMCQVVAYRRFKTVENFQTISRKSGHGRLRRWSFTRGFSIRLWLRTLEEISSITIIFGMTYSKHLCQSFRCHLLFFHSSFYYSFENNIIFFHCNWNTRTRWQMTAISRESVVSWLVVFLYFRVSFISVLSKKKNRKLTTDFHFSFFYVQKQNKIESRFSFFSNFYFLIPKNIKIERRFSFSFFYTFTEKWKLKINFRLLFFIFSFLKKMKIEHRFSFFIFHFSTFRKNEWP